MLFHSLNHNLAIMCIMEQTKPGLEHRNMKLDGLLNKLSIIFSFLNRRLLFWIIPTHFKTWLWVNMRVHTSHCFWTPQAGVKDHFVFIRGGWGTFICCLFICCLWLKRTMQSTLMTSCCSLTKTANHTSPSGRVSLKTEKVCAFAFFFMFKCEQ